MKIIFTDRAYVSVLAETAEKIQTETGGIFLGYRCGENWYVMEAIDPGPKSIFEIAYFEYDYKYVNHLSTKIARLYKRPLELLGLWHRHPGSFDQFSGTDDGTNRKFAGQSVDGAISALVNVDPEFRLTVFHVGLPLAYTRVQYAVGDDLLPEKVKGYCDTQRLLDYISAKESSIWGRSRTVKPRYKYDELLGGIINCLACNEITERIVEDEISALTEDNITYILSQIEEDVDYLGECYLNCQMDLRDKYIRLVAKDVSSISMDFCVNPMDGNCMFRCREKYYSYTPKMFKTILRDVVAEKQRKRIFFSLNKEFVECSIRKLERN